MAGGEQTRSKPCPPGMTPQSTGPGGRTQDALQVSSEGHAAAFASRAARRGHKDSGTPAYRAGMGAGVPVPDGTTRSVGRLAERALRVVLCFSGPRAARSRPAGRRLASWHPAACPSASSLRLRRCCHGAAGRCCPLAECPRLRAVPATASLVTGTSGIAGTSQKAGTNPTTRTTATRSPDRTTANPEAATMRRPAQLPAPPPGRAR